MGVISLYLVLIWVYFRDSGDRTVLHWSAYNGTLAITRCALLFGANVEAIDASGDTALHWACIKANFATIRMLILGLAGDGYKSLLEAKDAELRTPRDWLEVSWGPEFVKAFDEIVRIREIKDSGISWPWHRENSTVYTVNLFLF